MRVLILDDDPNTLRAWERTCRAHGHEPHLACTVKEALGLLDREAFDAAVLDFHLGGETSLLAVGAAVRALPVNRVVVVTGDATLARRGLAAAQLAVTVYDKLTDFEEVLRALSDLPTANP